MKNNKNKSFFTADDIFGALSKDLSQNLNPYQIIERSDGFMEVALFSKYFDSLDDIQKNILSYAQKNVLDLGAGIGRHSLYLQNQGHHVVAFDLSKEALKIAVNNGVQNVICGDIYKLKQYQFSKKFNTILLMGGNFGFLNTEHKLKLFLTSLEKITDDKINIIMQGMEVSETSEQEHLQYQKNNLKAGKPKGTITMRLRYKNMHSKWFTLCFYSLDELKNSLNKFGWQVSHSIKNGKYYFAVIEKK